MRSPISLLFMLFSLLLLLAGCVAPSVSEGLTPTPTAIARIPVDGQEDDSLSTGKSVEGETGSQTDSESATDSTSAGAEMPMAGSIAGHMGMGQGGGPGMGPGMGPGGNLRNFHSTPIAEDYAGQLSPIPASAESIARGEPLFAQNCASCHGETGLGDGPAGAALDPAPPMIAMTSQMLGDDYMFWRISEGGGFEPFLSAMPAWKAVLSEEERWDVINYVRSLGSGMHAGMGGGGQVMAGPGMNAGMEAMMRAEMLAAALESSAITAEEAELFDAVHDQIDQLRAADPTRQFAGTMRDLQDQLLEELVTDGTVSEDDAASFYRIHDILEQSGLMQ